MTLPWHDALRIELQNYSFYASKFKVTHNNIRPAFCVLGRSDAVPSAGADGACADGQPGIDAAGG